MESRCLNVDQWQQIETEFSSGKAFFENPMNDLSQHDTILFWQIVYRNDVEFVIEMST